MRQGRLWDSERPRGFTLIELLIVVAIIAILAAIAVPNLMEAQVRGKVARVKNDLRALATAMEAYRTDHNTYAYGFDLHPPGGGVSLPTGQDLTSPVSYISSIPMDPFGSSWQRNADVHWHFGYDCGLGKAGEYSTRDGMYSGGGYPADTYMLESMGPDKIDATGGDNPTSLWVFYTTVQYPWLAIPDNSGETLGMIYDATNGTRSRGNIFRVGGVRNDRHNALAVWWDAVSQ